MIQRAGVFFFFCAFLLSCETVSDDSVRPEIKQFALLNPTVTSGESLEIRVEVADNENLTQVRLRIRDEFSKSFGAWGLVQVDDISGTLFERNYMFLVPDSALSGYYSVALQVADERGNGSIDSIQYFTISREGLSPLFSHFQTNPPFNSEGIIQADTNTVLTFEGGAQDDAGIQLVEINLRNALGSNIGILNYEIESEIITDWYFAEQADTVKFSDLSQPPVSMVIRLQDMQGHQTRREFSFQYNP